MSGPDANIQNTNGRVGICSITLACWQIGKNKRAKKTKNRYTAAQRGEQETRGKEMHTDNREVKRSVT
ncbi:hypothetical protein N7490_009247 [Penicillium lividum]|nr:hypothetical protein N7490_009247 [Penicillium lividum]